MSDQRKEIRTLVEHLRSVKITLLLTGATIEVNGLLDVSPFGVGVSVSQLLPVGQSIELFCECPKQALRVQGTLIWSKRVSGDQASYHSGILLQPAQVQQNLEFFQQLSI